MIKIYSKENCTKCDFLKEALTKGGVVFEEFKLNVNSEVDRIVLKYLTEKATGTGFPIAEFADGTVLAGDVEGIIAKVNTLPVMTEKPGGMFFWGRDAEGRSAETW